MCELCSDHVDVGAITNNLRLLVSQEPGGWKPGRYAVAPIGGRPLLTFTEPPQPDPWDGWSDERVDASSREEIEAWCQWQRAVDKFRKQILLYPGDLEGLMDLPEMFRVAGWDKEQYGHVDGWLFHMCGVALRTWRRTQLHGSDLGYDQEVGKPNGFAPLPEVVKPTL